MKIFAAIFVACWLSLADAQRYSRFSPEYVDGNIIEVTRIAPKSRALATYAAPLCPTGKSGQICDVDCATLMTCRLNVETPLATVQCSTTSPGAPYCNPGTTGCNAIPSSDAECKLKTDFECTDIGYFPEPKNCSRYVYCGDTDATLIECPPGYVYDSPNEKCKRRVYTADCVTINCSTQKTFPVFLPYTGHRAFYALCVSGVQTLMLKCSDTVNFQFNPATTSCEFVCKADGLYPDFESETMYYECFRSGSVYRYYHRPCPTGTVFDLTKQNCVRAPATTTAATVATTAATTVATTAAPGASTAAPGASTAAPGASTEAPGSSSDPPAATDPPAVTDPPAASSEP